ncbi:DUF2892 domain-containing protein [Natronolimnohabitans innermongolicus]|uniref:DUF2892 domain-containing protein n=1 Tax=Natronolimnohabitans innermongolicus JCM 12255 TaxID=1227499 RepID=L9X0Z0_9EURY|nr:DUF2892 domain-containing protein [Natronolimnohabitans innermongolicus]ELY54263.1 hypothetical protein C493_12963 [Natronolimnohabitans innermongolicus JCM 12255]
MSETLPGTAERVPTSTPEHVNERLREEIGDRLRYYADNPDEIDGRVAELEREWDVERTLEANASALILVFLGLGATVDRRLLAMPAVIAAFLFQHALQGWCPPVPVLRRLGVRTQREIDAERRALEAIRDAQ